MKRIMSARLFLYFVLVIVFIISASSLTLSSYFMNFLAEEALQENRQSLEQVHTQTDFFILKSMNELALSLSRPNPDETDIPAFFSDSGMNYIDALKNIPYELNDFVFQNRSFVNTIYLYSKDKSFAISHKVSKFVNDDIASKLDEFSWISEMSKSQESILWLKPRNTIVYDNNYADRANIITLVSTYPVSSAPSEAEGYIAVNIKEEVIYDFIVRNTPANSGKLLIIDNQGNVISHYDRKNLYTDLKKEAFIKEILSSSEPRSFKTVFNGTEHIVAFLPSEFNNWFYVAMLPTEPIFQKAGLIRTRVYVTSLIILVLALILAMFFSNRIPVTKALKSSEYEFLSSHYLHRLLIGKSGTDNGLTKDLAVFGIHFTEKYFIVVEFVLSNDVAPAKNKLIKYIKSINNASQNGVNSVFYPISSNNTSISVIINSNCNNPEVIKEFISKVQFYCFSTFNFHLTTGIGRFGENMDFISQSFIDAKIAIQYKFLYPDKNTFFFEEISGRVSNTNVLHEEFFDRLNKALKTNNSGEVRSILNIINKTFTHTAINYNTAKKEVAALRRALSEYITEIDIKFESVCSTNQLKTDFTRPKSINAFTDAYLTITDDLFRYIEEKKAKKNTELVETVRKYIINNLNADLSLTFIADILHITPQYLSKIFKEQTGTNFIDYITICKLEESKKLLATTNMNMDEIAGSIGYNHGTNFSRKFKEATGLTPGQYRLMEVKKHLKIS